MDQPTHSWIAIRAIALLEDEGQNENLVSLLKPHAQKASVGAWLPDQTDAKRGGGILDNHVLKIKPYPGNQRERFIVKKEKLLKEIGTYRMTYQFLKGDSYLDKEWWEAPYRGDVPNPGQHLPNRIMAVTTMMKDLLLMGNEAIDSLIPGDVAFAKYVEPQSRTREEAASTYFFMLSHFVADVCMPCHCDERKLSGYKKGLHKELEDHWAKKIGNEFEKENLLALGLESDQLLRLAREVDSKFNISFGGITIPDLKKGQDPWLEAMYLCRASFAIASIIAPCKTYPYEDPKSRTTFDTIFGGDKQELLASLDQTVLHDAVLNTAIIWKHIWNKVSKDD